MNEFLYLDNFTPPWASGESESRNFVEEIVSAFPIPMSILYGPAQSPTHRARQGSSASKQNWRETYYETPPSCSPTELFSSPSESEISSIHSCCSPGLRSRNSCEFSMKSSHYKQGKTHPIQWHTPSNEGSYDNEELFPCQNQQYQTLLKGRSKVPRHLSVRSMY